MGTRKTEKLNWGLGLWWFTPLSTIFQYIVLVSFIGGGNPEKTTDLSQVTDKFYQIILYWIHLAWPVFELTTLVVISTDCKGSCKSNYHSITTTTVPNYLSNITNNIQLLPALKVNIIIVHPSPRENNTPQVNNYDVHRKCRQ